MVWRRGGGGLGAGGRRDAQSDAGRGRAARSTAASSSTAAPGDGNRTYAAIKFRGVEGWRPTSISAWRIMGDDLKQVRTSLTRSLWMSNLTKEEFVHVLRR
uniref:Uncharacterized protein n=1 Tax=Oryza nivara TaxID=4536 RepID=A0A0E0HD79_ORYNI